MDVKCIEDRDIAQGDLVFIFHKEKPVKSGWWRKIRCGKSGDKNIIYVLEKPLHKDFSFSHQDVKISRIEHGTCAMKQNTLSYGINTLDKFNVLIDARGFAQAFIVNNNYLINCNDKTIDKFINDCSDDLFITNDGITLLRTWVANKINKKEIEVLAEKLI